MAKTYVDVEQLEKLFSEYAIPYTNIFDELTLVQDEDIAKELSPLRLKCILDSKEEVVATQVWTKEDICASMRSLEIDPDVVDEDLFTQIAQEANTALENCSDGFDLLRSIIKNHKRRIDK